MSSIHRSVLKPLPSEELAKKYRNKTVSIGWVRGCGIQPSLPEHKRVMGKVLK